jgi:NADH-quinone oxidoreductase subunit J
MNILFLTIVLALAIASLSFKKSIASLISFALMMLFLGLYYLWLDEKLLGLFQIFVYTGGISVLMLFGITLIGIEFPKSKINPWSVFATLLFFAVVVALFFTNQTQLLPTPTTQIENKALFADNYSDFVLIFALVATSLLYGTIKMMHTLKKRIKKGEKDV